MWITKKMLDSKRNDNIRTLVIFWSTGTTVRFTIGKGQSWLKTQLSLTTSPWFKRKINQSRNNYWLEK